MAVTVHGRVHWKGTKTEEGHRDYEVTMLVETTDPNDGPAVVSSAAALPDIGDTWTFGNEVDSWAFCTPFIEAVPIRRDEPNHWWHITYRFTTRPQVRDQTSTIQNPVNEPQKISGSFVNGRKKVNKDKDGNIIKTTSHEPIWIELDDSLPTVRIEQNVTNLELSVFAPMVNTVNDATLWGLGARKIRLSNASWQRKYRGVNTVYYTRIFEFDINFNTFDRDDIPNKGKKIIRGAWNTAGDTYATVGSPSVSDAKDFIAAKDAKGNSMETFMGTDGLPSTTPTFLATVETYAESDFTGLNIPSSL